MALTYPYSYNSEYASRSCYEIRNKMAAFESKKKQSFPGKEVLPEDTNVEIRVHLYLNVNVDILK